MTWLLTKGPYISKKTGTVVKYFRDATNPKITMKQVNVGLKAKASKISRSQFTSYNGQPQELKLTTLNLGQAFEFVCQKTRNGWKRLLG